MRRRRSAVYRHLGWILSKYVARYGPDKCWLWRATDPAGYGRIYVPGLGNQGAHRVVWEHFLGPIPDGLVLDHLCRVRACVNPNHLEAVTQAENVRRGTWFYAVNARKTHCLRGHPLSGDNLRVNSKGQRHCRECDAIRRRAKQKGFTHNPMKTHCPRGHAYSPENTTFRVKPGVGWRSRTCKACKNEKQRKTRLAARGGRQEAEDSADRRAAAPPATRRTKRGDE